MSKIRIANSGHERQLEAVKHCVEPPSMYNVLNNDDYTPMEFVVKVIVQFFSLDFEKAHQIMLAVHCRGRAVCGVYTADIRNKSNAGQSICKKTSISIALLHGEELVRSCKNNQHTFLSI